MSEMLKIKLCRSMIGRPEKQKKVLRGLGLTKLNKTILRKNNDSIRGMVNKVSHLVEVEEIVNEVK
jgi:large subunit ribosomal protein L30